MGKEIVDVEILLGKGTTSELENRIEELMRKGYEPVSLSMSKGKGKSRGGKTTWGRLYAALMVKYRETNTGKVEKETQTTEGETPSPFS